MKCAAAISMTTTLLAVGIICSATADAPKDATDPAPVEYVGTFHPKKARCAGCHAKATVSCTDANYKLKVTVDYSGRGKGDQPDRVIVLDGKSTETNLVFRNKRYVVAVAGDELVGKRLGDNAEVPIVLKMKRAAAEKAPPTDAPNPTE